MAGSVASAGGLAGTMPACCFHLFVFLMPFSPRVRFALAGSALAITAGALALPWYSSRMVAAGLQELATEHTKGDFLIRNLSH